MLELLSVAKWYRIDPEAVNRWSIVDFADRQEFMLIQLFADDKNALAPDEEPWQGPGS